MLEKLYEQTRKDDQQQQPYLLSTSIFFYVFELAPIFPYFYIQKYLSTINSIEVEYNAI